MTDEEREKKLNEIYRAPNNVPYTKRQVCESLDISLEELEARISEGDKNEQKA